MAHDVFISFSAKDKVTGQAVCATLESHGVRCWIAPRDVTPSMEWSECIIDAIEECRIMVLVFSAEANASPQIRREVERAVTHGVAILPLRIQDVVPARALEYFIGNVHWLDALTPPLETHLKNLASTVKMLLARMPSHPVPGTAAPGQAPAAVPPALPLPEPSHGIRDNPALADKPAVAPAPAAVTPPEVRTFAAAAGSVETTIPKAELDVACYNQMPAESAPAPKPRPRPPKPRMTRPIGYTAELSQKVLEKPAQADKNILAPAPATLRPLLTFPSGVDAAKAGRSGARRGWFRPIFVGAIVLSVSLAVVYSLRKPILALLPHQSQTPTALTDGKTAVSPPQPQEASTPIGNPEATNSPTSPPVQNDHSQPGDAAETNNWSKQDLASVLKAATAGVVKAQVEIANRYDVGRNGVEQDRAQALDWYRKAAVQGDANAQFSIGFIYAHGLGVQQDYAQALDWYKKAADQGEATAQVNVGRMYAEGLGVQKDDAQALIWYRKAAEQGGADAQESLGDIYRKGEGVPQDYAQALIWYHRAADQGEATAQFSIGVMYAHGLGVQQDYAQALEWYKKAADLGDVAAQDNIGYLYQQGGQGVPQDYAQALEWYKKAADLGEADAQYNLGVLYLNGQGVPKDLAQARSWFQKAADQGNANAKKQLAALDGQH